jgi:hypothetical protein
MTAADGGAQSTASYKEVGTPKNITHIGIIPISRRAAFRIGKIIQHIELFPHNAVGALTNGYEFVERCDLIHIRHLIEEHWMVFGPIFKPLTRIIQPVDPLVAQTCVLA